MPEDTRRTTEEELIDEPDAQSDAQSAAQSSDPSERASDDDDAPRDEASAAPPPELSLEDQLQAERDKNLRLQAELRNVRARAQREQQEALRYAEASFAKELLVVLDDLERAREAVRTTDDPASIGEGVRMVHEQFLKVLKDHRIEPIEAIGKPFDPDVHEALLQQPSAEQPAGVVLQEVARGYQMHGRVIRPARVVVSSGAPEGAEGEE